METTDPAHLPELMSIEDVAVWLRKSVKAVRNMRARGLLPTPIRVSGMRSLLWRRSDLSRWFVTAEARARKRRNPYTYNDNDSHNNRITPGQTPQTD